MSEQKYYVKSIPEIMYYSSYDGFESTIYTDFWLDKSGIFVPSIDRDKITKSELGKIMGGVFYRTFTHQFNPELAEELYKLGYKTTQTTEEWIGARYEFDNIWEWINPLIELVPIEEE